MKKKATLRIIAGIMVLSMVTTLAWTQQITVSGKVTDEKDGEPLIGVHVHTIQTRGTTTNIDGNYSTIIESGDTLIFSYIGFLDHKTPIYTNHLDVVLKSNPADTGIVRTGGGRMAQLAQRDSAIANAKEGEILISGKVSCKNSGMNIFGAEISKKDSTKVHTYLKGIYYIVAALGDTLTFKSIGYITKEIQVTGSDLDVALEMEKNPDESINKDILSKENIISDTDQQQKTSGIVVDESGYPLIGAHIIKQNAVNKGTTTNMEGYFELETIPGDELFISYIGFEPQTVPVKEGFMQIVLQSDNVIDEVVVTGTGIQREVTVTGAITSVNVNDLKTPAKNLSGTLVGGVSGIKGKGLKRKKQSTQPFVVVPSTINHINNDEFQSFKENRFYEVKKDPLSTFSIDVDVASYSQMRRHINNGELPPKDAVRIEEMINYFSYEYEQPTGQDPVRLSAEAGVCPWNPEHRLVKIGVKAREIAGEELPASNFVFLIDVSGSMHGHKRLDLVKSSLNLLVNNLRDKDRVAIVVYAGYTAELLPATSGKNKQKIREVIDGLVASGSTAGGQGIQMAYQIAEKNFIKGGNNRIILCTDGDFNVGISTPEGLQELVEEKRKSGVFLTVLGYGMGNYKDKLMQVLAEKGNGNYAYIDNLQEANKVLVTEFGGTLYTVAKDVKLQIEFNPEHVQGYRLVGYESRLLDDEDFNDDTKDAGEMGAGHTVTALYEIIPPGIKSSHLGKVDPLKYQKKNKRNEKENLSPELLTVKLRYKAPDKDVSKKIELPLVDAGTTENSSDFIFASAVAMYGQLLKDSKFKGDVTYKDVMDLAKQGLDPDELGYRREFIRLVDIADQLSEK